ncbi:MAG: family 20 glycosylhydrolase [Lentisphaerae bacterium]|nr:family 20 glycosylhydrolase [Lentisphaerota bacterium]
MKIIKLANPHCAVLVSPEAGGRITSLLSKHSGVEHVGPGHLQSWVKTGARHDWGPGMLMDFLGRLHQMPFDLRQPAEHICQLTAQDADVRFTKRFELDPAQPVISLHFQADYTGQTPRNVQLETFFQWTMGAAAPRGKVVTVRFGKAQTQRIYLPTCGAMYGAIMGRPFNAQDMTLALCDLEARETLLLIPGQNCSRFALLDADGWSWRGPFSTEWGLEGGQSLSLSLRLALCHGVAAVDHLDHKQMHGLAPHSPVCFTDQILDVSVSLASVEGQAIQLSCALSLDGIRGPEVQLTAPAQAWSGQTHTVQIDARGKAPGPATLRADFSGLVSQASILLVDPTPGLPLIRRSADSTFSGRALHLINSQHAGEGPSLDALKWLVENVAAPCGFTHIIWEFNKALRLKSHPELAEPGAYTTEQAAELIRFIRACGLEPIGQQNFYGHQNETNLTKVYPELQERPGDLMTYCPLHPLTRKIVTEIVSEMLELFGSRLFHMGHDEMQFGAAPQYVGVCPRCRGLSPPEVFAHDVCQIDQVVKAQGARSMLWADHLIPPEYDSGCVFGVMGDVYKAIDRIPSDVVLCDWHYTPPPGFRGLAGGGFRGAGHSPLRLACPPRRGPSHDHDHLVPTGPGGLATGGAAVRRPVFPASGKHRRPGLGPDHYRRRGATVATMAGMERPVTSGESIGQPQ